MATEWPLPNTYPEVGICTGPASTKTPHVEHTFNILPPSIYLQYSSCDALHILIQYYRRLSKSGVRRRKFIRAWVFKLASVKHFASIRVRWKVRHQCQGSVNLYTIF